MGKHIPQRGQTFRSWENSLWDFSSRATLGCLLYLLWVGKLFLDLSCKKHFVPISSGGALEKQQEARIQALLTQGSVFRATQREGPCAPGAQVEQFRKILLCICIIFHRYLRKLLHSCDVSSYDQILERIS